MKNMLIGILLVSLMIFGCTETTGCETECPEGFVQQEDCTCISIDGSTTLKQSENIVLNGWNVSVDKITEKIKYEDGTCLITNENVKLKLVKDDESRTITLGEGGMEKLSNTLTLFVEDINQIFNIKEQGCEVEDKEILLNIKSSELSSRKEIVPVTNEFEVSSGTKIKLDSISLTGSYIEPYSNTYKYEEGEKKEIEDITIEIISITESTSIGDMSKTTITKSEGSQASLPGDYTIKIKDITQNIGSPDTNILTETYQEGNQVTLTEKTNIQIYKIDITTENCTEDCEIISQEVTLKVKPEGSRSTKTYTLKEGDNEFVSNRVRVQVLNINSDIECVANVCEIENKNIELRITTYNEECTITNKEVELELLFPDLNTETFTLGYGDEKAFITGERVKVDSITEDAEDSVNGTCEIDNEKVKLTLTLPSNECTSSNHRVQFKLNDGKKDYTIRLYEGDNETTGENKNIFVSADEFDIDVEYDEDSEKCIVNNEKVTLTVEVQELCKPIKEDIMLSYGNSKRNVVIGNEITIDDVQLELVDLIGDIKINGKTCVVSNKKAEFKISEPMEEDLPLEEGDTENFGDLKLTVEKLNFETTEKDGVCKITSKEAKIVFGVQGDENTQNVNEGDVFTAGRYTITALELNGDPSNDALYTCEVTDRQVKLKLILIEDEQTQSEEKTQDEEIQSEIEETE